MKNLALLFWDDKNGNGIFKKKSWFSFGIEGIIGIS